MNDKELTWRAMEAVIANGKYTEEQVANIRSGKLKPPALKVARYVIQHLTDRFVDPELQQIRQIAANAMPVRRDFILAGHMDNHAVVVAAKAAFEAGQGIR